VTLALESENSMPSTKTLAKPPTGPIVVCVDEP
jgi:hypothetical protein